MHFHEKSNVALHLSDLTLIDQSYSELSKTIRLYDHKVLGKVFIINDEIQHVEAWAPLYHESIVHIPSALIEEVRNVLIIGGGSFFTAKEVLKYDSIESVTMVDHDPKVLDVIIRNYSHPDLILNNRKFKLIIQDGLEYINCTDNRFDLIINDAIDLTTQPVTDRIFETLCRLLTPNGVCSDLIYRHIFDSTATQETLSQLGNNFRCAYSLTIVPEYPGVLHLLTIWGTTKNIIQNLKYPINKLQNVWVNNSPANPCVYYNPKFLPYYFYLPPYVREIINK